MQRAALCLDWPPSLSGKNFIRQSTSSRLRHRMNQVHLAALSILGLSRKHFDSSGPKKPRTNLVPRSPCTFSHRNGRGKSARRGVGSAARALLRCGGGAPPRGSPRPALLAVPFRGFRKAERPGHPTSLD
jgi:hypothetical protein